MRVDEPDALTVQAARLDEVQPPRQHSPGPHRVGRRGLPAAPRGAMRIDPSASSPMTMSCAARRRAREGQPGGAGARAGARSTSTCRRGSRVGTTPTRCRSGARVRPAECDEPSCALTGDQGLKCLSDQRSPLGRRREFHRTFEERVLDRHCRPHAPRIASPDAHSGAGMTRSGTRPASRMAVGGADSQLTR